MKKKTRNILGAVAVLVVVGIMIATIQTTRNLTSQTSQTSQSSQLETQPSMEEKKVWDSLIDEGYSAIQTASVMGTIAVESDFDARAESQEGDLKGLFLWTSARRKGLEAFAESKGKSWEDLDVQIEFLLAELKPEGGADGYANYQLIPYNGFSESDWTEPKDLETATLAFSNLFERPADKRFDRRIELAKRYYKMFEDKL